MNQKIAFTKKCWLKKFLASTFFKMHFCNSQANCNQFMKGNFRKKTIFADPSFIS